MQKRNAGLDILRALAIVLVVNCHISVALKASGPWVAFGWGGHGVDLFFVLSGWLLGYQSGTTTSSGGMILPYKGILLAAPKGAWFRKQISVTCRP